MKRYLPFVIIAGVLIIALAGGALLWNTTKQPSSNSPNLATQPFTQPAANTNAPQPSAPCDPNTAQPPPGPDNPHTRGNANAKVTLEEYGDYQCPSCVALYPELRNIEKDYGDQLRFVFRQFPLDMHKHALEAARAAEAAALQGHFWEMHDLIYQHQPTWSIADDVRPIFTQYATDLKLDVARFTRDWDSPEVAARVAADVARGKALCVMGTPTIIINGRQLRAETTTPEYIRKALDYMLGKSK